jgi:hypothetical protein
MSGSTLQDPEAAPACFDDTIFLLAEPLKALTAETDASLRRFQASALGFVVFD